MIADERFFILQKEQRLSLFRYLFHPWPIYGERKNEGVLLVTLGSSSLLYSLKLSPNLVMAVIEAFIPLATHPPPCLLLPA